MPAIRPSGRRSTSGRGPTRSSFWTSRRRPRGVATRRDGQAGARRVLGIPLTVGGGIAHAGRRQGPARGRRRQGLGQHRGRPAPAAADRDRRRASAASARVLAIDAARRGDGFEVLVKGGREGTGIDALALGERGRGARRGRDPAHLLGSRRHPLGLRPRAHGKGRGRRARAGDRLGWRGRAGAPEGPFDAGADAVLAASIFHDGELTVADVKRALAARACRCGPPIRSRTPLR